MKTIRYSLSVIALALGVATIGFAGEGDKRPVNPPVVTHVGSGMAPAPGHIVIEGKNLGVVQEVRLDGALLPVLRNSGYQLVIAPPAQEPGFAKLELFYPRGVIATTLEFTPTLVANRQAQRIDLTLHGSAWGDFYALSFSLRMRQPPLARPGIYYLECLDMNPQFSGLVGAGWFKGLAHKTFRMPVGTYSSPVFFQYLSTTDEGAMCYSNMVSVYSGFHAPAPGPVPMK